MCMVQERTCTWYESPHVHGIRRPCEGMIAHMFAFHVHGYKSPHVCRLRWMKGCSRCACRLARTPPTASPYAHARVLLLTQITQSTVTCTSYLPILCLCAFYCSNPHNPDNSHVHALLLCLMLMHVLLLHHMLMHIPNPEHPDNMGGRRQPNSKIPGHGRSFGGNNKETQGLGLSGRCGR